MGKGEKEESCSDSFFLKREREQEDSCSSESSVESQNMWWSNDWDASFLDILEKEYPGDTNKSWRLIAKRLREVYANDPLIEHLTPDHCKEQGLRFRKMYHQTKTSCYPSPRDEQLRRIFSAKSVPKFPRRTANPLSVSMLSRTMSRGTSSCSRSRSKSGAKHWKLDLVAACANLITSHNLNIHAVDDISDKLDTEMKVMVFLALDPDKQAREVIRLIGPCAFMPVESPPSASTQLAATQPFE